MKNKDSGNDMKNFFDVLSGKKEVSFIKTIVANDDKTHYKEANEAESLIKTMFSSNEKVHKKKTYKQHEQSSEFDAAEDYAEEYEDDYDDEDEAMDDYDDEREDEDL